MPNVDLRRKRRPKAGDIGGLRRLLWACLTEAERVMEADDPDVKLRAASTVATLGGVYLRALDQHDLTKQVAELRDDLERVKAAQHAGRYPNAA